MTSIFITPYIYYDLAASPLEDALGYGSSLSLLLHKPNYNWGVKLDYNTVTKDLPDLKLDKSNFSFSAIMEFKL